MVQRVENELQIKNTQNSVFFLWYFLFNITNISSMRKYDTEYQKILNKLTTAKPSEVGDILKEYFHLKKQKKQK